MRRLTTLKPIPLLLLLLVTGTLIALGAAFLAPLPDTPLPPGSRPLPDKPVTLAGDTSDIAGYAGNEACRPCHLAEGVAHAASRHARSLWLADRATLGDLAPPVGRINGSQYALIEKEGKFFFEVNVPDRPDMYQLWPIQYAFGSGKLGMTYVSLDRGQQVVELKMSWFPAEKRWRVTPGQALDNPVSTGFRHDLASSRRCFGCHVVALSRNAFEPPKSFVGVGCESCHGPGRAHIAAMQNGSQANAMPRLATLEGGALIEKCGTCHASGTNTGPMPGMGANAASVTYRFPPDGILQSRCFREGKGKLSCLSCHNPHSNVSTDTRAYERACLSCHVSPASAPAASSIPQVAATPGRACPVNARSGCIGCHMPKRAFRFAAGDTQSVAMTEHRIAVYPPSSTPHHASKNAAFSPSTPRIGESGARSQTRLDTP